MLSEKLEFSDQNYSESLLATLVFHYVQLIFKNIENLTKTNLFGDLEIRNPDVGFRNRQIPYKANRKSTFLEVLSSEQRERSHISKSIAKPY